MSSRFLALLSDFFTSTTWFVFSNSSDAAQFRQDLFNIARTTLSSKVLSQEKDYFANLAVDAVLRLKVYRTRCIYDTSLTIF
jgi:chaperonin GroEL (HSP60 family)